MHSNHGRLVPDRLFFRMGNGRTIDMSGSPYFFFFFSFFLKHQSLYIFTGMGTNAMLWAELFFKKN
jgi:hypothetical protein